jgi:DNA (cytosine-5)-methyltransferase 1
MRLGLEPYFETVWANDIEAAKRDLYVSNFGEREFRLADVRDVHGNEIPDIELATASFPCTDLSLAGNRKGLGRVAAPKGTYWESSMFWEFARVIDEMGSRRPRAILCENVVGFATSNNGHDMRLAIEELNRLGYSCDLLAVDARHFVAQSRPRIFVVALIDAPPPPTLLSASETRPAWALRFYDSPGLRLHAQPLPPLPEGPRSLAGFVDELPADDASWWDNARVTRFVDSLSPIQARRLGELRALPDTTWRTAYRRTRQGRAVWEIRADGIAGCLRTARGGSSKQALVETGAGTLRIRWMSPREYARLMGGPDFVLPTRRNQALFGFGDAVCVSVARWLAEHYLAPLLAEPQPALREAA